jgi:cytidine deaminase
VENVSLGLTICAERSALAAAVAGGEKEILTIAIVSDCSQPVFPCGACRQVLAEFNPDVEIIASTLEGRSETTSLSNLLPRPGRRIQKHIRSV